MRLTTTQIKYCLCHRPLQFLYQSTHRHPFITGGIFPEWSHKYLYGKTSNLYTSRAPVVCHYSTGCWSPSMHLSDPGRVSYRGGDGGIYPPHDFGKGGISPPSNCRTVFFLMGILVKSFKKVFRRQIPFFSKFVFSNCLPV